jgi:predicted dehydrogenase
MKYLVIGAGSIGKRHMRNLILIGTKCADISAVEIREDRRKEIMEVLKIKNVYKSLGEALGAEPYDAAIVCAPTHLHIPMGIQLAQQGFHILMEKPLSHNLDRIGEFKEAVARSHVIVEMAYIFRYSPGVKKIKELLDSGVIGRVLSVRGEFSEYLPDWHPWEDYRDFYMAKKTQGGGSILDQSHIMDLIHYLIGEFKSVFALNTKLSNLEIEADDIAEMVVTLKNGVVASIHTDIFGRDHKKSLEIKGEKGNIFWDHYLNKVRHYDAETRCTHVYKGFPSDFNLCYIDEIKRFISCCQGKEKPLADLQTGIETMELIRAAEKSHRTQKVERVGE